MAVQSMGADARGSYDSQSFDLFNVAQQQVDEAFREQGFEDIFKMPESMKDIDRPLPFSTRSGSAAGATASGQPAAAPFAAQPQPVQSPSNFQPRPAVGSQPRPATSAQPRQAYSNRPSGRPAAGSGWQYASNPDRQVKHANNKTASTVLLWVGIIISLFGLWIIGIPLIIAAVVLRSNANKPKNPQSAARRPATTATNPAQPSSTAIAVIIAVMLATALIAVAVVYVGIALADEPAFDVPVSAAIEAPLERDVLEGAKACAPCVGFLLPTAGTGAAQVSS